MIWYYILHEIVGNENWFSKIEVAKESKKFISEIHMSIGKENGEIGYKKLKLIIQEMKLGLEDESFKKYRYLDNVFMEFYEM